MEVKVVFDDLKVRDVHKLKDVNVVMVKGEKGDTGTPTDAQAQEIIYEYLDEHPEAISNLGNKADAIVKSASGSIASFDDGGDMMALKSLLVNIVPKQSGSGDPSPSNVRPISGWDAVVVNHTGKNLFNHTLTTRTVNGTTFTVNEDKSITISGTPTAQVRITISSGIVADGKNAEYFSTGGMPSGTRIYCRKVVNGATSYPTISPDAQFRVGEVFDNLAIEVNTSFNGTAFTIYPMVEVGTSATAYEPYNGTSYPISLGQTVYGGTLDVTSGKLGDLWTTVDLGSLTWSGSNGVFYCTFNDAYVVANDYNFIAEAVCSAFKVMSRQALYTSTNDLAFSIHKTDRTYLTARYNAQTSASAFKTAVNGVILAYRRATSTEVTLTPTEIKTLLGNNNIFADSGSVEVEYRADTTLAYNKLLSAIASLS